MRWKIGMFYIHQNVFSIEEIILLKLQSVWMGFSGNVRVFISLIKEYHFLHDKIPVNISLLRFSWVYRGMIRYFISPLILWNWSKNGRKKSLGFLVFCIMLINSFTACNTSLCGWNFEYHCVFSTEEIFLRDFP